jgi:hypothetical protein
MLKYIFLLILLIIIIYLARNKIIEPIGPIVLRYEAPKEETEESKLNTDIYITNNQINYDLIDNDIEKIIRQQQLLEYNYNNLGFKLGYIDNNILQTQDPKITIGGSYPKNIKINFSFPPPRPGYSGVRGEKGPRGPKGPKGPIGPRGPLGGNNYC